MALIPLLIAAALASSSQLANAAATQCSAYRINDNIGNKPIDGVPLALGVRTGMTRQQVEAIHPGLTRQLRRMRLEILPGLRLAVAVPIFRTNSAAYLAASGRRDEDATAVLTRNFGPPLRDVQMMELPLAGSVLPKSDYYKVTRYSWCDGPRVWLMSATDDGFTLEVRVLPQKDER